MEKRLIGPPITAVVSAGPPSGLDLRGLLPGGRPSGVGARKQVAKERLSLNTLPP